MKSYFARSVQKAMEDARRELGEDAILVTSRPAPVEAGQPRRYEVVFATSAPEKPNADKPESVVPEKPPRENRTASGSSSGSSIDAVLNEIREMREQLESLRDASRASIDQAARRAADPATRQLLAQLTSADVDSDLAQQLLAAATKRATDNLSSDSSPAANGRFIDVLKAAAGGDLALKPPMRPQDLHAAVAEEIRKLFHVDTGLDAEPDKAAIAALIGPPGAGKTSTIAKLAIHYGLKLRRPALLISTDNLRLAASEQLRAYATVLGLRFELAQSSRALGQLIEEHCGYGLILIDTPGFTPGELSARSGEETNEILRFLAGRTDIRRHLVLPAPMRCTDASRVSSAYEEFGPSHLIFSRMDETVAFGPVLNEAMSSGRPVSFFTIGQRVPEDLEVASAEGLINRLLPHVEVERSMTAAA